MEPLEHFNRLGDNKYFCIRRRKADSVTRRLMSLVLHKSASLSAELAKMKTVDFCLHREEHQKSETST